MNKQKSYVLDTNVLLESPLSIFGFDDNEVIITGTTLQELDSKKTKPGDLGYNARETCRQLEHLRGDGNLIQGITLKNGGTLRIEPNGVDEHNLPKGYSLQLADNRIISACITLKNTIKEKNVILVTNDVSMRINASACGLDVQSYRNSQIKTKAPYLGRSEIEITDNSVIDDLYHKGMIDAFVFDEYLNGRVLEENEFLIIKCGNQSALAIHKNGVVKNIQRGTGPFGITPKNAAQTFALYALTAPVEEFPIVILKGSAGTSKTFLSLAAGLEDTYASTYKNYNGVYDKLLITRNNSTIPGEEFGYLPGSIDEKMGPLLAPFFDNLEALLRIKGKDESNEQIQTQVDDIMTCGILDVCPIAYMRGRSISNSYLIVDECQNTTKSQMRDIITRIGEGSKLILCGDPDQIDNLYLDKFTNGLTFASERMKGSPFCAQITFTETESVRSPLATDALKRLDL